MAEILTIKVYYNDIKKKVKRRFRDVIDLYAIGRQVAGDEVDAGKLLYSYVDQDRDEIDLADQADIDTLLSDLEDWIKADPGLSLRIYVREPGTMRRWHDKYLRDAYVVDARTGMKSKYKSSSRKKEGFNSRPRIGKTSPEGRQARLAAALEGEQAKQMALPHKIKENEQEKKIEERITNRIDQVKRKAEEVKQKLEKKLLEELEALEKKPANYGVIDLTGNKRSSSQKAIEKASEKFMAVVDKKRFMRHQDKFDEDRERERNKDGDILVFGQWINEQLFETKFKAMKDMHPHEKVGRLEKIVSRNINKPVADIEKQYLEFLKKRNTMAMFSNRAF